MSWSLQGAHPTPLIIAPGAVQASAAFFLGFSPWLIFLPPALVHSDTDWDILWYDRVYVRDILDHQHLEPYQRVNHFRNHYEVSDAIVTRCLNNGLFSVHFLLYFQYLVVFFACIYVAPHLFAFCTFCLFFVARVLESGHVCFFRLFSPSWRFRSLSLFRQPATEGVSFTHLKWLHAMRCISALMFPFLVAATSLVIMAAPQHDQGPGVLPFDPFHTSVS